MKLIKINKSNIILSLFLLFMVLTPLKVNSINIVHRRNNALKIDSDTFSGVTSVWVVDATEKIFQSTSSKSDLYTSPRTKSDINLIMAKNSKDYAQVVITASDAGLTDVSLTWDDLTSQSNTIDKSNIKAYLEYYINVRSDTYYESINNYKLGYYPDALIPISNSFKVTAGENQPIWIEFSIPVNAVAGDYQTSIHVNSGTSELGSINLSIKVLDFALPDKTGLFNPGYFDFWELEELDPANAEYLIQQYTKFFNDKEIVFSDSFDVYDEVPTEKNGNWDFQSWFGNLKMLLASDNFASQYTTLPLRVPVGFDILGYDTADAAKQSSYDKYTDFLNQFKQFITKHSSEISPNIMWFVWINELDEPDNDFENWLIAKYAELTTSVNDNSFKFDYRVDGTIDWQAEYVAYDLDKDTSTWLDLSDKFNMWLAPIEDFEWGLDYIQSAISHNRHVMIYQQAWTALKKGDEEIAPSVENKDYEFPSLPGLVNPALFSRILPWFSWKYNLTGIGFWATMAWYNAKTDGMIDPYVDDPAIWYLSDEQAQNGDGFLIYPGDKIEDHTGQNNIDGPVSSIRLELFYKGLEDFKYLQLLSSIMPNLNDIDKQSAKQLVNDVDQLLAGFSEFDRNYTKYDSVLLQIKQFLDLQSINSSTYKQPVDWTYSFNPSPVSEDTPKHASDEGGLSGFGIIVTLSSQLILIPLIIKKRKIK